MSENEAAVAAEELWIAMSEDIHQLTVIVQVFLVIFGILLSAVIVKWIWRRIFKFALSFIKF